MVSRRFKTDWIKEYDAVFDNPIPSIFPQLDYKYPNSKFILTLRNEKE